MPCSIYVHSVILFCRCFFFLPFCCFSTFFFLCSHCNWKLVESAFHSVTTLVRNCFSCGSMTRTHCVDTYFHPSFGRKNTTTRHFSLNSNFTSLDRCILIWNFSRIQLGKCERLLITNRNEKNCRKGKHFHSRSINSLIWDLTCHQQQKTEHFNEMSFRFRLDKTLNIRNKPHQIYAIRNALSFFKFELYFFRWLLLFSSKNYNELMPFSLQASMSQLCIDLNEFKTFFWIHSAPVASNHDYGSCNMAKRKRGINIKCGDILNSVIVSC